MNLSAKIRGEARNVRVERLDGMFVVVVDGVEHHVDAHKLDADFYSFLIGGKSYEVSVEASASKYWVRHGAAEELVELADPSLAARESLFAGSGPEKITAVMPGKVVRILVVEGEVVNQDQGLVVLEAMKMENEIAAPRSGKVVSIPVKPGQTVENGAELVVLE